MTTSRECLIVVAHFPPIGGGGVVRIVNFASELHRAGWHVTVLTPEPEFAVMYERPMLDLEMLARAEAVSTIVRVPFKQRFTRTLKRIEAMPPGRSWRARLRRAPASVLLRIMRGWASLLAETIFIDPYAGFVFPALRESTRMRKAGYRPDVVVATSPPHSVQYAGYRIARLFGAPFVGDLRDQWYGNPHPLVTGRPSLNRHLEETVVGRASAMTTATEESAEQLVRVHGQSIRSRTHWMPNGFDGAAWDEIEEHVDPDRFVLTYVGTLYEPRDIESLARAIESIAEQQPELLDSFVLRLVGPVSDSYAERLQRSCGADLDLIGTVSQSESLRYMSRATVLLVVLHPGEGSATAIPGKIYEYMAAHRPLLALVGSGAAHEFITDARLGLTVAPDDTDGITAVLMRLLEAWRDDRLDALWSGPDQDALARYDRRNIAARFEQLLVECADRD